MGADVGLGRKVSIVVQSDSLTWGYVSGADTESLSTGGTRWIDRVALRLSGGGFTQHRCAYQSTTYVTRNFGTDAPYSQLWDTGMGGMWSDRTIPASTAPAVFSVAEVQSQTGAPDLHVIQYGTNDAQNSMSAATYETNIRDRIADFPDARLTLMILAWPKTTYTTGQRNIFDSYRAKLDTIAAESSSTRLVYQFPTTFPTGTTTDTTGHLNQVGHDYWYERLWPVIAGRL